LDICTKLGSYYFVGGISPDGKGGLVNKLKPTFSAERACNFCDAVKQFIVSHTGMLSRYRV
jgi:hypothetical protein